MPPILFTAQSYICRTGESPDPSSASTNRPRLGDRSNGKGGRASSSSTIDESELSTASGYLSPRCVNPTTPNKPSPVPKLLLPSNVYQETVLRQAGRGGQKGMTAAVDQEQFKGMPPLPNGWIRVRSKTTGSIYFCYLATGETTYVEPIGQGPPARSTADQELPPGWHQMMSRSNGKPYYWNPDMNKSQFEHPCSTTSDPPDNEVLPPGWVKMISRSTGRPYYFNSRLQLSQLQHPGLDDQNGGPLITPNTRNSRGCAKTAAAERATIEERATEDGLLMSGTESALNSS